MTTDPAQLAAAVEVLKLANSLDHKAIHISHANTLKLALDTARAEVARLKHWKDSALDVMAKVDFQAIGKEMGLQLGEDISPGILLHIRKLKDNLAASQKRADALAEALRWYAGNNSWQAYGSLSEYHPKIRDCGQIAKAALAQHDAEKTKS